MTVSRKAKRREPWRPYVVSGPNPIPAVQARILWNEDLNSRVCDVLVDVHPQFLAYVPAHGKEYSQSGGAAYSEWLNPPPDISAAWMTPEGTFGCMAKIGFANNHELLNAIVQFARIEGCVWAQSMLCSMFREDEQRTLEEAARRHRAIVKSRGMHAGAKFETVGFQS